jgi:hypothetical protein
MIKQILSALSNRLFISPLHEVHMPAGSNASFVDSNTSSSFLFPFIKLFIQESVMIKMLSEN